MGTPIPTAPLYVGSVVSFDATRGLGTVASTGGQTFDFHATAIADGSRRIDPGTGVAFVVRPAHRGRFEARALTVLEDEAPG